MFIIFLLSNQQADDSTKLSDGFIERTIVNVYSFFNDDTTYEKLVEIKDKYSHPVRKMAHFTIYLILGLLVFNLLKEFDVRNIFLLSLFICFMYACSDELHQLFVIGRSGEVMDVFIDTCGSFIGILIYSVIYKKVKKN